MKSSKVESKLRIKRIKTMKNWLKWLGYKEKYKLIDIICSILQ